MTASLAERTPRTDLFALGARVVDARTALPIALGAIAVAGIGDAVTGAEAVFTLFYLVPIALVAWFHRPRTTFVIVALAAISATSADVFVGARLSHWKLTLWNGVVELGVFVAFAWIVGRLRHRLDVETELRRSALDQLRHAERLNTVGKLASGLAHELGTPLNVITGRADLIAEGRVDLEGAKRSAHVIGTQASRMATLIRQLLTFARRGGVETTRQDLHALCLTTADLLQPMASARRLTITVTGGPLVAPVNRAEIEQVVTNLIANAIDASEGSTIEVNVATAKKHVPENGDVGERDYAVLCVRDHGSGISAVDLPHVFDPFFTTKDIGKGTGLGLAIVYGIVRDHGGAIRVESAVGRGTTFFVHLPLERRRGPFRV